MIEPCASPLVAMNAPSSGPNGWHWPPISSAKTSATRLGSRAGIDTWWIISALLCRLKMDAVKALRVVEENLALKAVDDVVAIRQGRYGIGELTVPMRVIRR